MFRDLDSGAGTELSFEFFGNDGEQSRVGFDSSNHFFFLEGDEWGTTEFTTVPSLSADTWMKISIVRRSGDLTVYRDEQPVITMAMAFSYPIAAVGWRPSRAALRFDRSWPASGAIPCIVCKAGTFAGRAASSQCLDCPSGKFSPVEGGTVCISCGPGKFSQSIGAVNVSTCQNCPAGTYSRLLAAESRLKCTKCYANSNSSAGSSSHADCVCVNRDSAVFTGPVGGPCAFHHCEAGFVEDFNEV
jgi:hypothetical protein